MVLQVIFGNGSHGTGLLTDQTFIAILAHPALKDTQGRDKAKQSAQGTEIPAPESWG
jgi:hypothetical protein